MGARTPQLRLAGDIDPHLLALFLEQLASAPAGALHIDLEEAELPSAVMVARLADALRKEAARIGRLSLIGAPQVLAHTLYRIGALEGGRIELIEPRSELGTAG